jgi:DHA1 family bicyclomycin/chloramphenicol resistance-like MFS transporter
LLALIPAMNFSAFFLYIASAPSFLIELLGVSSLGFGWLFVPMIAGIMLGASVSGRLAGRISPKRTIRLAYAIMIVGVLVNLLVCRFFDPHVAWNVLPIMIFTIGSSLAAPSITLLMLDLFPAIRGMASSLQGFLQFAVGAFTAGTIAPFLGHSLAALALGMAAFGAASLLIWLSYQRRARVLLREWKS